MIKHLKRRDGIILGVTAALLVGGIGGFSVFRSYQEVSFLNGLDMPVTVEVDGSGFTIEKDGRAARSFREGIHEVRVLSASGQVIDEGPIDVPAGFDAVVYNVLGAAPLYKANIIYSSSQGPDTNNGQISFLGGSRLAAVEKAQYVFAEAPRSITIDKRSTGSVTRMGVNVAKGGWLSTVSYLEGQNELMKAAAIARAVAQAEPGDERAFGYARHFTDLAEGVAGTLRFLRVEKTRAPDNADAELAYISTMRRADRTPEARAELEAKYKANPSSPFYGVLFARVASRDEARGIYEALLQSHPEDPLVRRTAAAFASSELDFAKVVDLLGKMQDDPHHRYHLDDHAQALVGLGRTPEAIALVSRVLSQEATRNFPTALLYARIARLSGAGVLPAAARAYVDEIAKKPGAEGVVPLASSLLGEPVSVSDLERMRDDSLRRTIEIHVAAGRDPKEAREKCASASPLSLSQLNRVVAALLAAEFARAGELSLAHRILASREDIAVPPSALLRYVLSGAEHPDLWRLDLEVRAALDFVRARRLDEEGQPSAALLEAVTRGDVLQGFLTLPRKAWPKLATAAEDKGKKRKAEEKPPPVSSPVVVLQKEKLL